MSVTNKEEIMNRLKEIIGEDTSDSTLQLLEDVSDTMDSLSTSDNEDWKKKYTDLDNEWRAKYKERFFSGKKENEDEPETEENTDSKEYKSFDDLFKD